MITFPTPTAQFGRNLQQAAEAHLPLAVGGEAGNSEDKQSRSAYFPPVITGAGIS